MVVVVITAGAHLRDVVFVPITIQLYTCAHVDVSCHIQPLAVRFSASGPFYELLPLCARQISCGHGGTMVH